jgi:hypothetical protein
MNDPRAPFTFQIASDIVRDGLGIELLDATGEVVAEVFRSDGDKTILVRLPTRALPPAVAEELMHVARQKLDPFEDGTPLSQGRWLRSPVDAG